MLASPRTYRLMAALMAVLLLVGNALPLVQHACAMAIQHGQMDDHPCPGSEQAPAQHSTDGHGAHGVMHGDHGAMHDHGTMHGSAPMQPSPPAEQPCPHKIPHEAPPEDCCAVEAAQDIVTRAVPSKRLLEPILVQAAVPVGTLSSPDDLPSHALFFDTGPPPASVSLHLLHAVLLN